MREGEDKLGGDCIRVGDCTGERKDEGEQVVIEMYRLLVRPLSSVWQEGSREGYCSMFLLRRHMAFNTPRIASLPHYFSIMNGNRE